MEKSGAGEATCYQLVKKFSHFMETEDSLPHSVVRLKGNVFKLSILRNKSLIFYVRNVKFNNEYALPK
jgi:hypothetical protein